MSHSPEVAAFEIDDGLRFVTRCSCGLELTSRVITVAQFRADDSAVLRAAEEDAGVFNRHLDAMQEAGQ